MKKSSLLLPVVAVCAGLLCSVRDLPAQSPAPTASSPSPSPTPPCPTGFGWAEGLVKYMAYPAPPFPTQDTANNPSTDCAFHQWSWEAFVWATAIGPDGRARFATLANVDELGQKTPAKAKGPKPLSLKPRDLKPLGPRGTGGGNDPAQAGGGILVDQNGQILWYSAHMNDIYYQFLQQYTGMNAYNKAADTLNFPLGAAVFKASWQVVPDGTTPTGVYTEKTTVPALMNNPKGGIMIDPNGKPRNVTVALVGLHVVGVTVNHPEFLWATFEQVNNAPDLADPSGYNSPKPVSGNNFTFYASGTAAKDCNPSPQSTSLKVTDPVKQTVAPITNVFRQYATGGENAAGDQEIAVINTGAQGVMANMASSRPPRPAETVWGNYKLIGTLWIKPDTLAPGVDQLEKQGVGSINLANATLETFFQGPQNNFNGNAMANCFMCHNTVGSGKGQIPVYPGKNINLSHALLGTLKGATTAKPTPALTAPVKESR